MHVSALETGRNFFKTYCGSHPDRRFLVADLGSQDLNGSLRSVVTSNVVKYTGIDFVEGKGVDVVLKESEHYNFPFVPNTFDVVVTSSCFEHAELFWLSFMECMKILKPNGLLYVNAPSSWMSYHRYPQDCWRFYPDAAKGLETWARYNKLNTMVLESYITPTGPGETVADFVGVFLKDKSYLEEHPYRMIDNYEPYKGYFNGFRFPETEKFPNGWKEPSAFLQQTVCVIDGNQLRFF